MQIYNNTGKKSPAANAYYYFDWADADNAYASDDAYAYGYWMGAMHDWYEFNIPTIPAGAEITDVRVYIEHEGSGLANLDVMLSWDGGMSTTESQNMDTSSNGISSVGGTWGRTWSPDDFTNYNFLVIVTENEDFWSTDVDHIQVAVAYKDASGSKSVVVDPFTETSDTTLANHVPNTKGTGWTLFEDNDASLKVASSGNYLTEESGGLSDGCHYRVDDATTDADYNVIFKIKSWYASGSDDPVYLFGRIDDTDPTYPDLYAVEMLNNDTISLWKRVGSTTGTNGWTQLGSNYSHEMQAGDIVELSMEGATIKVFLNGGQIISVTDSSISAKGKGGLGWGRIRLTGTHDMDAHQVDDFEIWEAAVVETKTVTHGSDALLKGMNEQAHWTDSQLEPIQSQEIMHYADSYISSAITREHGTDSLLRGTKTSAHSTDSLLQTVQSIAHQTDAYLISVLTIEYSTDALLQAIQSTNHITDTLIRKTLTSAYLTDALLQAIGSVQHATDSLLSAAQTISHITNSLLQAIKTVTHATDAALRATIQKEHSTSSLLQIIQTVTHESDGLLQGIFTISHSTDALLQAVTEIQQSTDAFLIYVFSNDHSTDVLLRISTEKHFDTDALLQAIYSKAHGTDALLRVTSLITHQTGSLLCAAFMRVQNADALLRVLQTKTHNTDSLLGALQAIAHDTNALLRSAESIAHNADAFLRGTLTISFSNDSFLKSGITTYTKFHIADALLRATFTISHSTNSLLRKAEQIAHHTDVLLFAQNEKLHSSDSLFRGTINVSHETNALLKGGLMALHETDSLLYRRFTVSHDTDSRLIHGYKGTLIGEFAIALDDVVVEEKIQVDDVIERQTIKIEDVIDEKTVALNDIVGTKILALEDMITKKFISL